MGRLASPGEVADAVVYLASERASYITGSVLSVSHIQPRPATELTLLQVDGGYNAQ
jgi:NAD(P)-dependent dehydrogenase (short-subunit alcohol dehydrogenase family)